jgi:tetratricopeptide (TPR) repeat protein
MSQLPLRGWRFDDLTQLWEMIMRSKPLAQFFFCTGLIVGCSCNRTDSVKPTSNTVPGPSNSLDTDESGLKDADAYATRAYEWLCKDNYDKALKDYDQAIRLKPLEGAYYNSRGFTWHMKGINDKERSTCEDRALSDYAEAIRIDPEYASAINNRAWIRATSKIDRCRSGKQAVEEATKACELTGWKNAGYLDTLSVAYAEVGDFEQAIRWQRKALKDESYSKEEGLNAREKLALYRNKQPFRE